MTPDSRLSSDRIMLRLGRDVEARRRLGECASPLASAVEAGAATALKCSRPSLLAHWPWRKGEAW